MTRRDDAESSGVRSLASSGRTRQVKAGVTPQEHEVILLFLQSIGSTPSEWLRAHLVLPAMMWARNKDFIDKETL